MALSLERLTLKDLFRELAFAIREFGKMLDSLVEENEKKANTSRIKELIEHIKKRAPVDKHEEGENDEIRKLLSQVIKDKRVLKLERIEMSDWLEFLETIEKRLDLDKEQLQKEDLAIYTEIKNLATMIRDTMGKTHGEEAN